MRCVAVILFSLAATCSNAFLVQLPKGATAPWISTGATLPTFAAPVPRSRVAVGSQLYMSSLDRASSTTTKKGTQVIDKTQTQEETKKIPEEMWRVVLHNDEVHTFNYVVRSLTKVIGTLDRKAAFEICVQTHGIGKATVTKTWKKQAEQFCLGLQRQGLTVSISPDEDFEGGHSGGGL